jgi:hypothetical protein
MWLYTIKRFDDCAQDVCMTRENFLLHFEVLEMVRHPDDNDGFTSSSGTVNHLATGETYKYERSFYKDVKIA